MPLINNHNSHHSRYEPPRLPEVIENDIKRLENDFIKMLREATK
jgi:hypothetical protein